MSGSIESRQARIETMLEFMLKDAEEAKASRKTQYEMIEKLNRESQLQSADLAAVKTQLAGQTPTIEEFITIKHKVVGAGKLGKWVWLTLGGIITFLFSSREAIIGWLVKQ